MVFTDPAPASRAHDTSTSSTAFRSHRVWRSLIAPVVAVGLIAGGAPAVAFADEGVPDDPGQALVEQASEAPAPVEQPPADAATTPEESSAPSAPQPEQPAPAAAEETAPAPDEPVAERSDVAGALEEDQPLAAVDPYAAPYAAPYDMARLTLRKAVVNDDGGVAVATDWTLQVSLDGLTWQTLPHGVAVDLPFGTYVIRETGGPADYEFVDLTCDSYRFDPQTQTIALQDGDDNTCTFTNDDTPSERVDLSILKTHGALPENGVDYADAFTWHLEVTNVGTLTAVDAVVTDTIPAGLTVTGVTPPAGWTDASVGSEIRVTIPSLAPGESGIIDVAVQVEPAPAPTPAPFAPPGTTPPALAALPGDFVNTACVQSDGDVETENDCSTDTVPRKSIVANAWVSCINDAPFLMYQVATSPSLAAMPITLSWTPTGSGVVPASVIVSLQSGDSGRVDWPGVKWNSAGVSYDWPGWRPLVASDYGPDGLPLPGLEVYNDSVRDSSEPDEAWRQTTLVTFSVNPTISYTAVYPLATPQCAEPARTAGVLAATGGGAASSAAVTLGVLTVLGGAVMVGWSIRRRPVAS